MITLGEVEAQVLAGVAIFGAGIGLGWKIYSPKPLKPETWAAPVTQTDGSVILERKPDPSAKPDQIVPKGAVVERVVHLTVQSHGQPLAEIPPTSGSNPGVVANLPVATPQIPCPPMRVNLTLLRMQDESRRVVASSPDGDILDGVDIPVDAAKPQPKPLYWSGAGLVGYDNFRKIRVYGGAAVYSRGPFTAVAGAIGRNVFVGAGIKF